MLTPLEIKQGLGWGGQSRVAEVTHRSVAHVYYVIGLVDESGNILRRRDKLVEREIAKRLKLSVRQVFGAGAPPTRASA